MWRYCPQMMWVSSQIKIVFLLWVLIFFKSLSVCFVCICLWALNYLSVLCVCFCALKRSRSRFLSVESDKIERDKEGKRAFQPQKTKRVITWEKREPLRLGREPFSSGPLELVAWFVPIIVSLLFTMFLSRFFVFFFNAFGMTLFKLWVCVIKLFDNFGFWNWEWWWGWDSLCSFL